jgi:hypothetical protein
MPIELKLIQNRVEAHSYILTSSWVSNTTILALLGMMS